MLTYSRLQASADAARVSMFVIASLLCAHTGAGGAAGGAAGNDGCANFDNARFRRCLKESSPSGYPSMPLTLSHNRFFRMTAKPPKLPTTLTNRFRSTSTPQKKDLDVLFLLPLLPLQCSICLFALFTRVGAPVQSQQQ